MPTSSSSTTLTRQCHLLLLTLLLLPSHVTAFSALDRPRDGFLQDVLQGRAADQNYCKPTGLIQDACCDFETVESVNSDLFHSLHDIVATPYFRYHKVDLYRECPFWQEDGSCMNRACGVETTEEEHIPEAWRSQTLGKLKSTRASPNPDAPAGCRISDSDFCVLEDEMDSEGVYVDLLENPERFTGYAGQSSSRVWKAIYEENCFTPVPYIDPSRSTQEGGTGFAPLDSFGMTTFPGNGLRASGWGDSEKKLLGSLAGPRDGGEEVCLEKRVFYRVISGLHASISIHICDDYLDQKTGQWAPNLQCFITRISQHPERLQNVYFTYVLLLRALSKSGPQLLRTLHDTSSEPATIEKLGNLIKLANGCPSTFDETSMFSGLQAEVLKDEFKSHFRNISRIMDCVGCDKCRLWGKMQVTGLGTALKLLFSYDDAAPLPTSGALEKNDPAAIVLSRGEAVAFVNTLHRLSESLAAVDKFRVLWAHRADKDRDSNDATGPIEVDETVLSEVLSSVSSTEATRVAAALETAPPKPSPSTTGETLSSNLTELVTGAGKLVQRLRAICEGGWRSCRDLAGQWSGGRGESWDAKAEL